MISFLYLLSSVLSSKCWIYNTDGNGICSEPPYQWVEDLWGKKNKKSFKSKNNCLKRTDGHNAHCGTQAIFCYADDFSSCPSPSRPFTQVRSDVECADNSDEVDLGRQYTVEDCAEACRNSPGCRTFIYGKGEKADSCYDEGIDTASECKRWEKDQYDVYELEPFTMVRRDELCKDNSHEVYLGRFDNVDDCAEACRWSEGCKTFIYGKGDKKGYCYDEGMASEDHCNVWQSDQYNFYTLNYLEEISEIACDWVDHAQCTAGRQKTLDYSTKVDCVMECQMRKWCTCVSWNDEEERPCRLTDGTRVRSGSKDSKWEALVMQSCPAVGVNEAHTMSLISDLGELAVHWNMNYFIEHGQFPNEKLNKGFEQTTSGVNKQLELCGKTDKYTVINKDMVPNVELANSDYELYKSKLEAFNRECHINMKEMAKTVDLNPVALKEAIMRGVLSPAIKKGIELTIAAGTLKAAFVGKATAAASSAAVSAAATRVAVDSVVKSATRVAVESGVQSYFAGIAANPATGWITVVATSATNAILLAVGVDNPAVVTAATAGVGIVTAATIGALFGGGGGAAISVALYAIGWTIQQTITALFRLGGRGRTDNWAYIYVGDVATRKGLLAKTYRGGDSFKWTAYRTRRFFDDESGFISSGNKQKDPFQIRFYEEGRWIHTFKNVYYRDAFFINRHNGKLIINYAMGEYNLIKPGVVERYEYDVKSKEEAVGTDEEDDEAREWEYEQAQYATCQEATAQSTLNAYSALVAAQDLVFYGLALVGLVGMYGFVRSAFQKKEFTPIDNECI